MAGGHLESSALVGKAGLSVDGQPEPLDVGTLQQRSLRVTAHNSVTCCHRPAIFDEGTWIPPHPGIVQEIAVLFSPCHTTPPSFNFNVGAENLGGLVPLFTSCCHLCCIPQQHLFKLSCLSPPILTPSLLQSTFHNYVICMFLKIYIELCVL